ncbi:MAG: Gfo/Idh/MocA family oxidoreductase [Planctomycetota bacterium]|nr:Gfo/Idh/MocA family oxidoreductase [Planctomycetota bacterium]
MNTTRPLRLAMVGGGPGAFIGAVHRTAALMDGHYVLVAGALSSDPAKCAEGAAGWGIDPSRAYGSWQMMLQEEASLPADERAEVVSIVTPNHLHHEVAIAALDAGFHVACDKPLTTSSERAAEVAAAVERAAAKGVRFLLTHNYTGSPRVREARELVAKGEAGPIGTVRKVYVEYLQGWLATDLEASGQKQAAWRTNPELNGPGGSLGDIGTHAHNLAEFITGMPITAVQGTRRAFVKGRPVDDDAMALITFENGADGTLCCSQVCVGRENGLAIRVFGTKGGLEWHQEHPNDLTIYSADGGAVTKRTGNGYLSPLAQSSGRVPPGHPEGYLEAFANLYTDLATSIRSGEPLPAHLPSIEAGLRGVRFIEDVIASSEG